MKGVHWIELGQWPPALVLIADKRAYRRFARAHCGAHVANVTPFPSANAGACQKWVDGSNCLFVITVGPQKDQIELAGTLAHEATHMMRWLFEQIGEQAPGTEAQAYLVEHVVRHGMKALAA